jgi:hypothetical protein
VPFTTVSRLRLNGTFQGSTTANGIVLSFSGRYAYRNGILSLVYDNGWLEQDSIVSLNPNQVLCTCIRSNGPGAVGLQVVSTRRSN